MMQRKTAYSRRQTATNSHKKVRGRTLRTARAAPLLTDAKLLPFPHSRLFGYARVSTEEQNLDVQLSALRSAGVHDGELYVEKISAVNAKRPIFNLMMKMLERGDTLLLHSLSRVGRELPQILGILGQLNIDGVAWRSITEPHLDNSTSSGRLMLNITGAMAQFERDQIVDRTRRGMAECRRKGMWLGRRALFDERQAAQIKRDRQRMTRDQAAAKWKCSAGTIDKYSN